MFPQIIDWKSPFFEGAFEVGPLTRNIGSIPCVIYNFFKKLNSPNKPVTSPNQQQQQQQQPTGAPTLSTTTYQPTMPAFRLQYQPWSGPIADSPAEAAQGLFRRADTGSGGRSTQDWRDLAYTPVPERMGDPALGISLPKLEYRPAYTHRRKTTERLNKSLWQLNPSPIIVDRFRHEQEEDMRKKWDLFEDRSSKVYYDRLRQWLTTNIMDPTLKTVSLVENQLPQQGTNFVNCPPNILALLIVEPNTMADNAFPIMLVQKLISVKGYENDRARQHVLERLKELVNRPRYHSLLSEADLPSDSEIIIHIFNTYLEHMMPHIVPLLVPLQGGDVYKLLLVFFFINEELKKEIFD
ncbi:hypothetical protein BDB00DRAFT_870770 [Zychaea mexicana]|uniref:uncharacterized protein n=1 Tax=Zychaea mexicana TaxID=64656 RepID=UPI0022FDF25B|nr:uncharacterized protein BDB00DRAFT_870770 [Zychaea mexicana]KAI9495052.1 hypothetical protein BDB00DRAFT_870770 [Zychaea mexicana]